ncbi:hypothetical protein [Vibrio mediterranei]|uniref:hypothetical protein n=1 Tax=Vibrio mediterranei TaxID=689 RepID=UPI004068E8AC
MTVQRIGADNRHVVRIERDGSWLLGKFLTINKSYLLTKKATERTFSIHDAPLSILDGPRDHIKVSMFRYDNMEKAPYWCQPEILLSPKSDLQAYDARKSVNLIFSAERAVLGITRASNGLQPHQSFVAMAKALGAKEIWFPSEHGKGDRYRIDDIQLPEKLASLLEDELSQAA